MVHNKSLRSWKFFYRLILFQGPMGVGSEHQWWLEKDVEDFHHPLLLTYLTYYLACYQMGSHLERKSLTMSRRRGNWREITSQNERMRRPWNNYYNYPDWAIIWVAAEPLLFPYIWTTQFWFFLFFNKHYGSWEQLLPYRSTWCPKDFTPTWNITP